MMVRCQSRPLIRSVKATYKHIDIYLSDGTHISAPLDWYPYLPNEKIHDRAKWESMRWWVWQHLAHQRHLKCVNPDKLEILIRQNPKRLTQGEL